jgi:hypothetical protein
MSISIVSERITVSERLSRQRAVEKALANLRLEGLYPATSDRVTLEQFIEGELTEEQLANAILGR